jgi:DNA-directed RNA polymerase specialized sigma subunit
MKTDWRSNRTGTLQGRTNYKAMKAKKFLKQYEYAKQRAEKCKRTYELEMERIDAIGSTLAGDGTPHGSGISRKTEDKAIRLADKAQQWLDAEEEAQTKLEAIAELVCSIDGIEGQVLYQRYINLLTWEQVAETLCYSLPGVFNVHQRALEIVDRRLDNEQ